jgi:hypothetical protein
VNDAQLRRVLREMVGQPEERDTFRRVIGVLAVVGGFACLVPLYFVPIPDGNKEALLLAIGIVLGWGGTIVTGEWGSSPAGRAAARVALRQADEAPSGRPSDPVATKEIG